MVRRKLGWIALGCTVMFGCDDAPVAQGGPGPIDMPMDAATPPNETPTSPDSGTAVTPIGMDSGVTPPARVGPAYVVINSDWSSTTLSLLDDKGDVLKSSYLTSASTPSGLVTTLSGDVVLPGHSGEQGVLVILDRFRTDVLTRIRLQDGVVLGQVKTHTPPGQDSKSSFSSNPHDYIYIDEHTAWITRSEPNLDPGAPEIDLGDDLLRIDPATMTRTSDRISLSVLDQKIMVTDPKTNMTSEVQTYVRPSSMVRIGNTVVVGTGRSAFDFKAVADGAVAIVDLATKAVTPFLLPGLKNCTSVDTIPGDADSVLVSCGGDWNTGTKATAGFVIVGIANGTANIERVWRARDDSATNPLTAGSVSLGGTLVGAAANDYTGNGTDVYAVVDLATNVKSEIAAKTPGAGVWGSPTFDAASGLLLLPDASTNKDKKPTGGLRRFQRQADGSFKELTIVNVAPESLMPVRHVFPL